MRADLFIQRNPAGRFVALRAHLPTGADTCEDVSELNGLIIPGLYERGVRSPAVSAIDTVVSHYMRSVAPHDDDHPRLRALYDEATSRAEPTIADYARLVVIYYTVSQRLHHKVAQIPYYDWIRPDDVSHCHDRMKQAAHRRPCKVRGGHSLHLGRVCRVRQGHVPWPNRCGVRP